MLVRKKYNGLDGLYKNNKSYNCSKSINRINK